jgi:hypothetical protein
VRTRGIDGDGGAGADPGHTAEILEVEGVRIRVTPRMLDRMKRNTVRPQDRLDAEMLKQRFGLEED